MLKALVLDEHPTERVECLLYLLKFCRVRTDENCKDCDCVIGLDEINKSKESEKMV